jgi:hypothetical protein
LNNPTPTHQPTRPLALSISKRAEFEQVGQPKMAWDVLKEQLNSKKHRSAWSSVHEKLMVKFIDISIELQK